MAGRKRKPKKGRPFIPVVVLCLVVIVCIVFTGLIVVRMLPQETATPDGVYHMENVYVVESVDGKIRISFEGKLYEFDGRLAQNYTGIADLDVEDGKVMKLYTKPDQVEGILSSYTDDEMEIEEQGIVRRKEKLPIYVIYEDGVTEGSFDDLIVGTSRLTYVFDHGEVCALIRKEKQKITGIRILLKNGDSIFRKSLKIRGSSAWKLGGKDKKKDAAADISKAFSGKTESVTAACKDGVLYICDDDGEPTGYGYEGEFIIHKTKDGYVLVNDVPMETYLRYVLPSEMLPTSSYEALKAQAICARTFAYTQMAGAEYAEYGANLDDSTAYQVYNTQERDENTDRAVEETQGQVLTCDGELVTCYYYSTSPGVTEDMEVWGSDSSPSYIKRTNCLLEGKPGNLSSDKKFYKFIHSTPKSYDSDSPFYRWTAQLNLANVEDEELGVLEKIQILSRSKSGFVTSLRCIYDKGERTLTSENQIRFSLGDAIKSLKLADGTTRNLSSIPSACFEITGEDGYQLVLTGGGFGHCVGMSQSGADAMGKAGKNCEEILTFYYSGTKLMYYDELQK